MSKLQSDYQVKISCKAQNTDWDTFLAETSGGYHTQTSAWGQVKSLLGREAIRIIVRKNGRIVGGAQMLIRPMPFAGTIGYVPRGPLFAFEEPTLTQLVLDGLHQVANDRRVQMLVIQPPKNNGALERQLLHRGFQPSSISLASTATLQIDIDKDLDDILAQMTKTTRKYIRRGERRGLVGREGTERDLPAFYDVMKATSQRQQFSPFSMSYFSEMWRLLQPWGHIVPGRRREIGRSANPGYSLRDPPAPSRPSQPSRRRRLRPPHRLK